MKKPSGFPVIGTIPKVLPGSSPHSNSTRNEDETGDRRRVSGRRRLCVRVVDIDGDPGYSGNGGAAGALADQFASVDWLFLRIVERVEEGLRRESKLSNVERAK